MSSPSVAEPRADPSELLQLPCVRAGDLGRGEVPVLAFFAIAFVLGTASLPPDFRLLPCEEDFFVEEDMPVQELKTTLVEAEAHDGS